MHIAVGVGRLDDPEPCAGDRNTSSHECPASPAHGTRDRAHLHLMRRRLKRAEQRIKMVAI